jgi:Flp pilus assembly protein CpaB
VRHQSLFLSRLALRRRPLLYWCATVVAALAAAAVVGSLTARAEAAAARYGGLRSVVVVARPLDPGDEVAADDVRIDRVPRAFVPDGAFSSVPEGRTALVPLSPGEAVLASRLAPDGLHGVAALLPEGTRAMAVPAGPGALRVRIGDVVDVLATAPDGSTRVAADAAVVVDVGEATTTVAVLVRDAPAVATALTQATVTLALAAPG